MTEEDWGQFGREIADAIKAHTAPLIARIEALEVNNAKLAARVSSLKYRGAWNSSEEYAAGNFATYQGGVWACLERTQSKPGTDRTWQLAMRPGRDGKDGKDARAA